jgi:hypothetical protein
LKSTQDNLPLWNNIGSRNYAFTWIDSVGCQPS